MQSPLRNVRKAHGFTLQHVAAGVQVNPATLSRIDPYFKSSYDNVDYSQIPAGFMM